MQLKLNKSNDLCPLCVLLSQPDLSLSEESIQQSPRHRQPGSGMRKNALIFQTQAHSDRREELAGVI